MNEPDRDTSARRLGVLTETIHALVYFAPESQAADAQLGLKGYWRGYFASRAAPLGEPGPRLVSALFGGFAPAVVATFLRRGPESTNHRPSPVKPGTVRGNSLRLRRQHSGGHILDRIFVATRSARGTETPQSRTSVNPFRRKESRVAEAGRPPTVPDCTGRRQPALSCQSGAGPSRSIVRAPEPARCRAPFQQQKGRVVVELALLVGQQCAH